MYEYIPVQACIIMLFVGAATPGPDSNPGLNQRSLNTGSSTCDTLACGQTRSNCRRWDTTNYPIHGSGQDDFLQLPTFHRPLRDRWCSHTFHGTRLVLNAITASDKQTAAAFSVRGSHLMFDNVRPNQTYCDCCTTSIALQYAESLDRFRRRVCRAGQIAKCVCRNPLGCYTPYLVRAWCKIASKPVRTMR
ncbi:hypothetical protein Pla100_63230 [Neorhodopirellula pilleata]|uniref:Uncharacterized protein n=1 Tax=Neorhodopirellula pilleata TaxID=2714738 RepID=A0A5C5YQU3_9BACT|nr:hypothetical protein Pla100_63230 [Neorhodopirellula pilleata]